MVGLAEQPQNAAVNDLHGEFLRSLQLIDRVHRRLLDVVEDEMERAGNTEINGVQALLLFHIGAGSSTAGALKDSAMFAGANVSYNLKKLTELDLVTQTRSRVDRRQVQLRLSSKGTVIAERIRALFERQATALEPTASVRRDDLATMNRTAQRLEQFWTDHVRFRL
jgi:hypothetical protein